MRLSPFRMVSHRRTEPSFECSGVVDEAPYREKKNSVEPVDKKPHLNTHPQLRKRVQLQNLLSLEKANISLKQRIKTIFRRMRRLRL
jgi:hypothetical protein